MCSAVSWVNSQLVGCIPLCPESIHTFFFVFHRSVEKHLFEVTANIHYQEGSTMMKEEIKTKRLNVELPFFSKYLLLAAYLASYNPISTDKRYFMMRKSGRVIKKSKSKQQSHLKYDFFKYNFF